MNSLGLLTTLKIMAGSIMCKVQYDITKDHAYRLYVHDLYT